MKIKFITQEECRINIQPAEKLVFSRQSFVQSINLPPATVFTAIHGNIRVGGGAQGTIYIFRGDTDSLPFNIDEYSFNSCQVDKIEIKGPLDPKKYPNKYHWTSEIPGILNDQAPQWVKEEVQRIRDRRNI